MYVQQKIQHFAKETQNFTNDTSYYDRQWFNSLSSNSLRASASLFNHFFKAPFSFGGDDPEAAGLLLSPKTLVIASAVVALVIERTHCVKSVHIRSYFGPCFPVFGLKTNKATPNTDTFYVVTVSIDTTVMPCSQHQLRIHSAKGSSS